MIWIALFVVAPGSCRKVPGVVCSGIDIDSGLIAKANAAAVAASVDSRCSFATRDALALVPKSDSSNAGVEPTLSDNAKSSSSDHHDKDEAEKATQQWAVVQAADTHIWPNAETRPISVVVRVCSSSLKLRVVHLHAKQNKPFKLRCLLCQCIFFAGQICFFGGWL
jgi:hypothetical protein